MVLTQTQVIFDGSEFRLIPKILNFFVLVWMNSQLLLMATLFGLKELINYSTFHLFQRSKTNQLLEICWSSKVRNGELLWNLNYQRFGSYNLILFFILKGWEWFNLNNLVKDLPLLKSNVACYCTANGTENLFYYSTENRICHLWRNPGSERWNFEDLTLEAAVNGIPEGNHLISQYERHISNKTTKKDIF